MDHSDEQNLLKKAINGDSEAFSALVAEYYMMIYKTAYKWCGNKEDAEDIAQDVCIKLGRSITTFRMDSRFSTWLYRIVVNATKDFQRKRKDHVDVDDVQVMADAAGDDIEQQAECQEMWQHVQQLPEKQRDAILLIYSEDLSHAEAAEIMECKESTVSWYIHEAKKQLNIWMGGDGR